MSTESPDGYEARVLARGYRCPRCGRLLSYFDGEIFAEYLYCDSCFSDTYDPISGIKTGQIE